jgi:hypothetical protein
MQLQMRMTPIRGADRGDSRGNAVFLLSRSLACGALKMLSALALGGAVLWEVALHCGPPNGTIYVHVERGCGDLNVDDATYQIKSLSETPVVCNLEPGRHVVTLSRDGRIVYEEKFSLDAGEELVLTAWERVEPENPPSMPEAEFILGKPLPSTREAQSIP